MTPRGMTDGPDGTYERLLVLRCQTGDAAALAELVARYGPRLRLYLRKLLGVGRPDAADDALQDVWVDVWRHVGRLADAGAFAPWVYRIARDRAYRELRRKRLPARAADEPPVDAAVDPGANGDDPEGFDAEDAAAVHAALDALPPEQREVVLLRFVEQMTYEQIAAVTASPVGTVRSRLFYAKAALRRLLGKDERP